MSRRHPKPIQVRKNKGVWIASWRGHKSESPAGPWFAASMVAAKVLLHGRYRLNAFVAPDPGLRQFYVVVHDQEVVGTIGKPAERPQA